MHKNSYTSGFKLPRAFLIVGVLALSLELYLHSLEGKVFFRFFRSDSLYRSVQEVWRHNKIDIAIVGSSTSAVLGSDLPLPYFDNQHGKPIVGNFSLYGADPRGVYRLLDELILSRVKPNLVMYVFQPLDLDENRAIWADTKSIPELDLYKRSKMAYLMTSFFQQHCFTYRYRDRIKTWISNNLFAINKFKRSVVVEDKSTGVGQDWEGSRKKYETFRLGDEALLNILQMKNLSDKHGAGFILVEFPPYPLALTISSFKKQHKELKEQLSRFCAEHKIDLVDLSDDLLREEYFRKTDAIHLSDQGVRAAIELLARQPEILEAFKSKADHK